MLEIIDQNTGKNVLFGGAEQTAATDHPDHPPAAAAAAAAATATLTATSATPINAESHRVSATVIFFLSLNNRKKFKSVLKIPVFVKGAGWPHGLESS